MPPADEPTLPFLDAPPAPTAEPAPSAPAHASPVLEPASAKPPDRV
ncbi:MAG: hypothetical protein WDO24_17520 [Pseudomonadota bacterium]